MIRQQELRAESGTSPYRNSKHPRQKRGCFYLLKKLNKISGGNSAVFRDYIRDSKPVDRFSVRKEAQ